MRARKTRPAWRFFLNYGQGWEHEITEYSRAGMIENRRAYRENYTAPLRVVYVSRESIADGCPCCRSR